MKMNTKMNSSGMHYFPTLDDASIEALLDSWRTACPLMGVLALLPEAEQGGVARLQEICARRKVTLVGAVFPALIESGEFRTQGLWLLRFERCLLWHCMKIFRMMRPVRRVWRS